jgi:hypothetical protein
LLAGLFEFSRELAAPIARHGSYGRTASADGGFRGTACGAAFLKDSSATPACSAGTIQREINARSLDR